MSLNELLRQSIKSWHGIRLDQPDWSSWSRSLAFSAELPKEKLRIHLIWNAFWESLDFELPVQPGGVWRRWIDTSLECPCDIVPWQAAPAYGSSLYTAAARSVVVLYARTIDRC